MTLPEYQLKDGDELPISSENPGTQLVVILAHNIRVIRSRADVASGKILVTCIKK